MCDLQANCKAETPAILPGMRARGLLFVGLAAAGRTPEDADTPAVRRYAAYLGTLRYAPSTAGRKLSAVRGLHAWLFARGRAERDPAAHVPGPKRPRTLPPTLSGREIGGL